MTVLRAYLKENMVIPKTNVTLPAGTECFIGQTLSEHKSSVTIVTEGRKFSMVADNNALLLDSTHVDLIEFHSVLYGRGLYDK
jgi:hypothetical protein